jgi:hypothetical protein
MMTYKTIKGTLSHENIERYVPDGVYYSKAVIGQLQERIVDVFFFFYYDIKTDITCSPYARIAVDSENKTLAYYYAIEEKPFNSHMPKDFVSGIPYDDAYKKWENIYEDCYSKIRDFAFESGLSDTQKTLLQEYKRSFEHIIDKEIQPFYRELSPEFWNWLEKEAKI